MIVPYAPKVQLSLTVLDGRSKAGYNFITDKNTV